MVPEVEPIPELLPQAPPPVDREAADRAYRAEVDALQAQANVARQLQQDPARGVVVQIARATAAKAPAAGKW
jgi:hypothetical protein